MQWDYSRDRVRLIAWRWQDMFWEFAFLKLRPQLGHHQILRHRNARHSFRFPDVWRNRDRCGPYSVSFVWCFKIDDLWGKPNSSMLAMAPCTNRIIFLADKAHTVFLGTDQRRQRVEASNLINSQSDKEFDLFEEEVHSTKSCWTALGDCDIPN